MINTLSNIFKNDKQAHEVNHLLALMQAKEYSILRPTLANLDNQNDSAFMFDAWDLLSAAGLPPNFDVRLSYSSVANYVLELVDNDSDVEVILGWVCVTKNCIKFFSEGD